MAIVMIAELENCQRSTWFIPKAEIIHFMLVHSAEINALTKCACYRSPVIIHQFVNEAG
jgi:hypothetical protein